MLIEKEALQYLVGTAQKAAEPKLIYEDDRSARYDVGGQIVVVPKPPPLANHQAFSLEDLVAAVLAFDADYGKPGNRSVWHADGQVIGVFDNADRRDLVSFKLTYAESFIALLKLESGDVRAFTQREFIELLDVVLGVDKAIIAPFRKLDWHTQIQASGEVTAARDRLGKDISAEVAGTAELPSDVLVSTPVYREKGEREIFQVRCLIRPQPAHERIVFCPVPGELDTAIEWAQGSIRQRLEESLPEGSAIFYGSP